MAWRLSAENGLCCSYISMSSMMLQTDRVKYELITNCYRLTILTYRMTKLLYTVPFFLINDLSYHVLFIVLSVFPNFFITPYMIYYIFLSCHHNFLFNIFIFY